jgi:hypothetical protein
MPQAPSVGTGSGNTLGGEDFRKEDMPSAHLVPTHPLRWLPEFWELGRRRLRSQARLLGLSLAVGVMFMVRLLSGSEPHPCENLR